MSVMFSECGPTAGIAGSKNRPVGKRPSRFIDVVPSRLSENATTSKTRLGRTRAFVNEGRVQMIYANPGRRVLQGCHPPQRRNSNLMSALLLIAVTGVLETGSEAALERPKMVVTPGTVLSFQPAMWGVSTNHQAHRRWLSPTR